jgi:hypothetical protein
MDEFEKTMTEKHKSVGTEEVYLNSCIYKI